MESIIGTQTYRQNIIAKIPQVRNNFFQFVLYIFNLIPHFGCIPKVVFKMNCACFKVKYLMTNQSL